MKSEQLNNLYEFDSLVSRETIDKARKLLYYITREYKIQKNQNYLINITDIKCPDGWKKVWDNNGQRAYIYENFIFPTYHSRKIMYIDVFLDVVYTQTDTGEWIEIDFNDYITRPLDDSEKDNLKVILNRLKEL
jgi:hypothetical protein|nr:MAG TPA: hypothetical protein [Caudoviricetes sp.]